MAKVRKKKWNFWWLIIIILAAGGVYWKFFHKVKSEETTYETSEIQITDIESIVSSTGTLSAVGTLEVGTQVSGRIDSVLVDFNDRVHKDQVLAILDRSTLKSAYRDAQSSLRRSEAQYELTLVKYNNDNRLYEKGMISEYDYKSSATNLINAESNLESARIALEKADQNLNEYAIIRSPIDGMVISREIESGQTVQASMSAPTLFILAKDLKKMEIKALVDESDIGLIQQGQSVRFQVEAYSEEEFTGEVSQVRLQPQTVSDVVHYTVICTAENKNGKLLPGMTATVEFVIASREQVKAVSNSALNIRMPQSVLEKIALQRSARQQQVRDTTSQTGTSGMRRMAENMGRIWYLQENGEIGMALVQKGLSDGINTELLDTGKLPENAMIITKVNSSEATSTNSQSQMMPRGPGLF